MPHFLSFIKLPVVVALLVVFLQGCSFAESVDQTQRRPDANLGNPIENPSVPENEVISEPLKEVREEKSDEKREEERGQVSQNECDQVLEPSLAYLRCHPVVGSDLSLDFVEAENSVYTRYGISYRSDGLNLSGVLLIPKGEGPFPLVLTNHGYIATSVYTRGRGLKREQDALARSGFAVLHPDYRNHAESDKDPENDFQFRMGYVKDVLGAIDAVKNTELAELAAVDANRVGMIGHSMGGGISMQAAVVQPEAIDAVVLYAPVSAKAEENLQRYFLRNNDRSDTVNYLYDEYGSPEESPEFWQGLSAYYDFEDLDDPVQIYIGTADVSVEPQWSYDVADQLERLGKDVELIQYEGAPHEFIANFESFKKGFVDFFTENL